MLRGVVLKIQFGQTDICLSCEDEDLSVIVYRGLSSYYVQPQRCLVVYLKPESVILVDLTVYC